MQYTNVAHWDRLLRVVVGGGLLAAGWLGPLDGLWAVACKLFGWVPLITGLVGFSPLYALLSISTKARRRR